MPKSLLLEDYHLTLSAPAGLRKEVYRAILRTLRSKRFQARLEAAVREVLHRYPSLKKTQIAIGR